MKIELSKIYLDENTMGLGDLQTGTYMTTDAIVSLLKEVMDLTVSVRSIQRLANKIDCIQLGRTFMLNLEQVKEHYNF